METKLKEVKDKIVAAVPEIMELKFGCEVKFRNDDVECTRTALGPEYSNGQFQFVPLMDVEIKRSEPWEVYCAEVRTLKILGRKIGLADVLLAVDQFAGKEHEKSAETIAIDNRGKFARITAYENGGLDLKTIGKWNLKKDDLEKQSPETISFLYDLLV